MNLSETLGRLARRRLIKSAGSVFTLLDGYTPSFTSWKGELYESEIIRASVHATANHVSKLSVKILGSADPVLQTKLRHGPNEWQTWGQFLYRLSTILDMQNTAFILPVFDDFGQLNGIFPVLPAQCELFRNQGAYWLKYTFVTGKQASIALADCGVMTKFQYRNDLFGEDNRALNPTMDLVSIQNQGIQEAVKNSASFRFMAQLKNFATPKDLREARESFNKENLQGEGGGVLLFPNTYANIQQLKYLLTILLAVFILLAFLISMFWIYALTKPLNQLISGMKTMGDGHWGIKLNETATSDFRFITEQFNQMSDNIQSLIHENQVIQEERHELAIQNLQSQLNPHFLYNTLNTIKWMAIVSKADNVAGCVTALGNLLQPLFRNTQTTWPLREELNYLKNYLCIMNYRTGEPVNFYSDIDPSIYNCTVPKFILQPLFENAISYSNPSSEIKNSISLTGHRQSGQIQLILQDNGLGIPSEKLTVLQNLLASTEDYTKPLDRASLPPGIGIGILNTNRRIKLQYGNTCGLSIRSQEGAGTCITILLADMIDPSV